LFSCKITVAKRLRWGVSAANRVGTVDPKTGGTIPRRVDEARPVQTVTVA
jgi:hypothetical protein